MHDHQSLSSSVQIGLGIFYLLCMIMNFGFASYQNTHRNRSQGRLWNLVACVFMFHGLVYFFQAGWILPSEITGFFNTLSKRRHVFRRRIGRLGRACFISARSLTEPVVAWGILQATLLFSGWAMTIPSFKSIITKPDNVPIVILIFSVGFTTWLALRKAVINDDRIAKGEPPLEKVADEKVLVWPDLVYTELICDGDLHVPPGGLGRVSQGAAGTACFISPHPQSVEGSLVFPWSARNARLFRSVDGRRGAADHDHRRPDRVTLHRLQSKGQWLLHVRSAKVRHHHVFARLHRSVGGAHCAWDVLARPELEFLRPVRALGHA